MEIFDTFNFAFPFWLFCCQKMFSLELGFFSENENENENENVIFKI